MGTQSKFYRPKIAAQRGRALATEAARIGKRPSKLLDQAIDQCLERKRGSGVLADLRRAVDVSLRRSTLDLARFELVLEDLSTAIKAVPGKTLSDAETLDHIVALMEIGQRTIAALGRDMFAAVETLRAGSKKPRK